MKATTMTTMNDDITTLTQYDHLLSDDADVAALVFRERLQPVQGRLGVFFPPTFAAIGQGRKSDYHIDPIGPRSNDPQGAQKDGVIANRCTVDSVPSQANRLEARLLRHSGSSIPRVTITGSRVGQGSIDLLEVGHRIGDAVVRYSKNGDKDGFDQFESALQAFVKGDAALLARLAPTSLVFGHWDSRDSATKKSTKSKARRLIRSEIVAYNVQRITKRSQYWSSIDPEVNEELSQILSEAKEAAQQNPDSKNPASQLGMTDVPAPETPGGVIAFGSIERTTIIALSGVRALATFNHPNESSVVAHDADKTLALRRYLFALALAAAADPGVWDLREGCILVRESRTDNGNTVADSSSFSAVLVKHSGAEAIFPVPTPAAATSLLQAAAKAFIGEPFPEAITLAFDPGGARAAISTRSGDNGAKPKNKSEWIKALVALPSYAGRDAELKKRSKEELEMLWNKAQQSGGLDLASSTESRPVADAGLAI